MAQRGTEQGGQTNGLRNLGGGGKGKKKKKRKCAVKIRRQNRVVVGLSVVVERELAFSDPFSQIRKGKVLVGFCIRGQNPANQNSSLLTLSLRLKVGRRATRYRYYQRLKRTIYRLTFFRSDKSKLTYTYTAVIACLLKC